MNKKWKFFIRIYKKDSFFAVGKYFIYIPHFAIGFIHEDELYEHVTFKYYSD